METARAAQRKRMVLCIENEPDIVRLITMILKRAGVEVIGASDGREGLDKVREMRPDLVLLDLMLPEMSGWEVYRDIKSDQALKDIPIIVVTVLEKRLTPAHGEAGGYIHKPFEIQDLLDDIKKALNLNE